MQHPCIPLALCSGPSFSAIFWTFYVVLIISINSKLSFLHQTNLKYSYQGRVPLVTVEALHQIHILIFFLAVLHVLYSAITMWLGRLKVIHNILYLVIPLLCFSCHLYCFLGNPGRLQVPIIDCIFSRFSINSQDQSNFHGDPILWWY